MRKIIFILLAILPLTLMAQSKKKTVTTKPKPVNLLPLDSITQKVTYSGVFDMEGRTKEQLYRRIQSFVADPAKIKIDDKDNGLYAYKGTISVSYPGPMTGIIHKGNVDYVVTFNYEAGKYSYVITDFMHNGVNANGGHLESKFPECDRYILTPQGWRAIKEQTKTDMESLAEAIHTSMKMP